MRNQILTVIMGCLLAMLFLSVMGCECYTATAPALATAPPPQPLEEAPYTGVIQNKTKYTLSVPSLNCGATLLVPPKSSMEYVAWAPDFQFIAYVDGKPYFCQQIKVAPKSYQYMCKNYDFLAEVKVEEPKTKYKGKMKPAKKLRLTPRSPDC